jgi:hypothetical protein
MNNPLRQYFRRPALYIRLPSKGNFYPAGALDMPDNQELPVYPMTAIDEITSRTPDALFNGNAVADIIKSCVPAIKDPWSLPSVDLDTILVAIRAATNGNELEIQSLCEKCENEGKYGVNLIGMLSTISAEGYSTPLPMGELKINFKPLTYRDVNMGNLSQFELQREVMVLQEMEDETARAEKSAVTMQKLTKMNMELIASTVHSITTPTDEEVVNRDHINEYLQSCDRSTYEAIRQHAVKLREAASTKPMKIKCVNCSHEYEQSLSLNITDFFE